MNYSEFYAVIIFITFKKILKFVLYTNINNYLVYIGEEG